MPVAPFSVKWYDKLYDGDLKFEEKVSLLKKKQKLSLCTQNYNIETMQGYLLNLILQVNMKKQVKKDLSLMPIAISRWIHLQCIVKNRYKTVLFV